MNYRQRIAYILDRLIKEQDRKEGARFKFLDERQNRNAYESAWQIPAGYSFAHILRQRRALEANSGGIVELENRGGVVIIRVIPEDLPKLMPLVKEDFRPDRLLMGYNRLRQPVYHPLNTHLLAGGASRAGKTDWLRFVLYQLWMQGYEIRICDLKGFSFFPFEELPRITIAKSLDESFDLLTDCHTELERRKAVVQQNGSRSIITAFQPIVIIIDEAASLAPSQHSGPMKQLAKDCDNIISLIGQQGREPRLFMIYTTQRPDMDVVNKQFKANVEASIAFRCKDQVNSMIILGRGGAEEISPDTPGRCIYSYDRDHVLQVPYVGDDDAWDALLLEHKKGLIDGDTTGTRAERSGRGTDGDDRPGREAVRQPLANQARVGGASYARAGEDGRRPSHEQYAEGVAPEQTGPGRNGSIAYSDTID